MNALKIQNMDNFAIHPSTAKRSERKAMSEKEDVSYTKTPNYLVDDDYVARMTGNALKCYTIINRFTEGFSRSNWAIDSSFLLVKTGIKKPHTAYDAVKQLEEFGLLSVHREDGRTNKFTITHPCQKTAVVPNLGSAEKRHNPTAEKRHNPTAEKRHNPTAEKRHTKKENIKKENIKESANAKNSPDEILNIWTPDLHSLNSWLQRSGLPKINQSQVDELLLEINPHYESKIHTGAVTITQMYSNFVKWIKRDFKLTEKLMQQAEQNNAQNYQADMAKPESPRNAPVLLRKEYKGAK